MSVRKLFTQIGPSGEYWIAAFSRYATEPRLDSNADSTSNYLAINDYLIKFNQNCAVQWVQSLDAIELVNVNSSDDIYVSDTYNTSNLLQSAKYDSSGNVLWQKKLSLFGTTGDRSSAITSDTSGNLYQVGSSYGGTPTSTKTYVIEKLNSSGVLQWVRSITNIPDSGYPIFYNIDTDSSNNVYCAGRRYISSRNVTNLIVLKLNSSGTLQWQRGFGDSNYAGQYSLARAITTDSNNNVYVAGEVHFNSGSYSNTGALLIKLDSSGNVLWQTTLSSFTGQGINEQEWKGVACDSSNNVYVCGYSSSGTIGLIAKYNENGTLQWQRTITVNGANGYLKDIKINANNEMYICGSFYDSYVFKLPSDGSLTGTYGNIVYSPSSFTSNVGSLPINNPTASVTNLSNTLTDTSYTNQTQSISSTVTYI